MAIYAIKEICRVGCTKSICCIRNSSYNRPIVPIPALIVRIAVEGPPAHESIRGHVAGHLGVEGRRGEKGENGEKGDKVAHGGWSGGSVYRRLWSVCPSRALGHAFGSRRCDAYGLFVACQSNGVAQWVAILGRSIYCTFGSKQDPGWTRRWAKRCAWCAN